MQTFKGTQGSWEVFKRSDSNFDIIQSGSMQRGVVAPAIDSEPDERLIAAAPRLLQTLQLCEKFITERGNDFPFIGYAIKSLGRINEVSGNEILSDDGGHYFCCSGDI